MLINTNELNEQIIKMNRNNGGINEQQTMIQYCNNVKMYMVQANKKMGEILKRKNQDKKVIYAWVNE